MHIENLTTHLTYKSWPWCKTEISSVFVVCVKYVKKEIQQVKKEHPIELLEKTPSVCVRVCVKAASQEWKHNQSHTMKPCWWEKAATHLVGRSDSLVLNIRAVSKKKGNIIKHAPRSLADQARLHHILPDTPVANMFICGIHVTYLIGNHALQQLLVDVQMAEPTSSIVCQTLQKRQLFHHPSKRSMKP